MSECFKNDERFSGHCCCTCANMLELHLHCNQVIQHPKDLGCICGVQIGWVCTAFGYEGQASLMQDNHGVCEMYYAKEKK